MLLGACFLLFYKCSPATNLVCDSQPDRYLEILVINTGYDSYIVTVSLHGGGCLDDYFLRDETFLELRGTYPRVYKEFHGDFKWIEWVEIGRRYPLPSKPHGYETFRVPVRMMTPDMRAVVREDGTSTLLLRLVKVN